MEAARLNDDRLLYLYGLLAPSADVAGLTPVEHGSEVFLIGAGDVVCAASLVPAAEYSSERSPADQLAWVTPRAWRHHEVLRRLHSCGTVVPMKFGTLCHAVQDVEELLRRLAPSVTRLLGRFADTDEWTLNLCADTTALAETLQATHPALLAYKDEELRLTGGGAYFAKKKLQNATALYVGETLAAVESATYERLAALGIEVSPGTARQKDHDCPTAVAETALLVPRQRFADVEIALSAIESEFAAAHVTFQLVGPWPPYSFAPTFDVSCAGA